MIGSHQCLCPAIAQYHGRKSKFTHLMADGEKERGAESHCPLQGHASNDMRILLWASPLKDSTSSQRPHSSMDCEALQQEGLRRTLQMQITMVDYFHSQHLLTVGHCRIEENVLKLHMCSEDFSCIKGARPTKTCLFSTHSHYGFHMIFFESVSNLVLECPDFVSKSILRMNWYHSEGILLLALRIISLYSKEGDVPCSESEGILGVHSLGKPYRVL